MLAKGNRATYTWPKYKQGSRYQWPEAQAAVTAEQGTF